MNPPNAKIFEMRLDLHDHLIGGSTAVLATAIPETIMSSAGKIVFAIVLAGVTSFVSSIVRNWTDRKYQK